MVLRRGEPAFDIVAVAASFGGIEAVSRILGELPKDLPAAVMVVQHRMPRPQNTLARVLGYASTLPVRPVAPGERPASGVVYVAPAGAHVVVNGGVFAERRVPRGTRPSDEAADVLLTSVAQTYGDRALAVVLTGRLRDGAAGAAAVKRAGGFVLAEDGRTARAPGMPIAALATGCVDHSVPLPVMARAIVALVMSPGARLVLARQAPATASA